MYPLSAEVDFDLSSCRVWQKGHAVRLSPAERELLRCLASRPGCVFSRPDLCDLTQIQSGRNLDVHVCRLRRKLDDRAGDHIQTVRKVGYRLNLMTASAGRPPGSRSVSAFGATRGETACPS